MINFDLVSMPEIGGDFFSVSSRSLRVSVRSSRSCLEKRDQIKGILVLVSMPESEDNKSRSRLDARDWRKFFLGLVSKPESKCQELSVSSR